MLNRSGWTAVVFAVLIAPAAFADYVCRQIDIPGSTWTQLGAINNAGSMVASSDLGSAVYSNGTWTFLAAPSGSGFASLDIAATGINDSGVVVGSAFNGTTLQGFIFNGSYTFFAAPGAINTQPRSISNSGVVLGTGYDGDMAAGPGFRREANGTISIVQPALPDGTEPFLVIPGTMNNAGQFVGNGFFPGHGSWAFVYDPTAAQFSTFQINGLQTRARGINNLGQIAAFTFDAATGGYVSWIQDSSGDRQLSCPNLPSVDGFAAESINDSGAVTGIWTDASGNIHGFLASPVTVASLFDDLLVAATGVGPGKSLANKVRDAKTAYGNGDTATACSTLSDFIAEVKAQSGKSLSKQQSGDLQAKAAHLMQASGCS